jgi:alkylation response protein AidB-like acyl-CoA dehydrogenase
MALRVAQNGLITLKGCRVPEADRLRNANSFKDTAKVLRMTRTGVAWSRSALSWPQQGFPLAAFDDSGLKGSEAMFSPTDSQLAVS